MLLRGAAAVILAPTCEAGWFAYVTLCFILAAFGLVEQQVDSAHMPTIIPTLSGKFWIQPSHDPRCLVHSSVTILIDIPKRPNRLCAEVALLGWESLIELMIGEMPHEQPDFNPD
jgi:hypothetical protein